ncbi:hypothetical protein [Paenibacillus eucommiae]|uniref:Uncharacterized protein n=1 Tax=Paenibacillus eucommiae TaxID=1355755 RepID=A0ABS4IN44_9BACL|nr:hypothetical protein [Paenibacillus eucommiae]MBP1988925.1 hypothetical protein [Paenibacillus eucommiae]
MDKRLTRTDYLFALMFIFMLVCILGAFFYGLQIGQQKSEQKYEKLLHAGKEVAAEPGAYDQQILVSYYHTIYLPFREFQSKWFEQTSQIESQNSTVEASAVLKELSKLADKQYKALQAKSMPASSPLLQEAHQSYVKSLKLFTDALKSYGSKANSLPGSQLLAEMNKNEFIIEAKRQALLSQKNYYASVVKWNESMDFSLKTIDTNKQVTLEEWKQLNLNVKNLYITAQLLNGKTFTPYYPQDVTIRIDDFIASGQGSKLGTTNVSQMLDLLLSTDAIRSGDFAKGKAKWYSNELLPQLPFFLDAN